MVVKSWDEPNSSNEIAEWNGVAGGGGRERTLRTQQAATAAQRQQAAGTPRRAREWHARRPAAGAFAVRDSDEGDRGCFQAEKANIKKPIIPEIPEMVAEVSFAGHQPQCPTV